MFIGFRKKKWVLVLVTILCGGMLLTALVAGWGPFAKKGAMQSVYDPYPTPAKTITADPNTTVTLNARTNGNYFYLDKNGTWICTFLKGVNMGLTLPTTDLSNPNIPYDTYMEWFAQIAAMHANTVKVYTVMNPDFYNALYDYDKKHATNPLYLLQGIWFNENDMTAVGDAYGAGGKIVQEFKRAAHETVDIVHGNSRDTSYGTLENAVYAKDVSSYTVGFVMGLEWTSDFVIATNKNHPRQNTYQGSYLQTQGASPFEAFLCEEGDALIDYETTHYHAQHPVAFLNWSTTDALTHSNEPFPEEDAVSVDTEHIHATASYAAGLFAAMDIYPYYPEFLNHQKEYVAYHDPEGKSNPYRAYLRDLHKQYSVPVVVAEFGVSTSRGIAHKSAMGYNQGGVSETAQGKMDLSMMQDIAREQYAGAMIFSWQDEWFKQTWNTVKYAPEDVSQRTMNEQSAEQHYGILAYEPGKTESVSYPDGDVNEWNGERPVSTNADATLYMKEDEGYLYLMGRVNNGFSFDKDELAVGISLTGRGSKQADTYRLSFSQPVDFLLVLNGKNNTRLLTDAYDDLFYYQYCVTKQVFSASQGIPLQNSGVFNPIRMFLSNEIVLPVNGQRIAPQSYEAGKLRFGNTNPKSSSYDSLADFDFANQTFEVRIPWYLLNVLNPAEQVQIGDFYSDHHVTTENFDAIGIGAAKITSAETSMDITSVSFTGWTASSFHARLKQSYSILAQGLTQVMKGYS